MKANYKFGFTLTEILIVLGVMALLSGIIFSTFITFKKSEALNKDTETIVEVLRQARSQTMSSQNASQYGVHFTSSQVTIFTGATYSSSASSNQNFILSSTDTLLTISLVGGGTDIVFSRLSGETSQNGTVVVSSPDTSRIKTVTIYKTGLVDSQ